MKENSLQLIPKYERYIQYMLEIILKLPRIEKFNIGNEFKNSMYQTLENILYIENILNKVKYNIFSSLVIFFINSYTSVFIFIALFMRNIPIDK